MIGRSLLQVIAQEANRPKIRPQDVFKAMPYTGTNTNQTIVTGLDMTVVGSLVWASPRYGVYDQFWASDGVDLSPNTNEASFYSYYAGPRCAATGFTLAAGAPHNEAGTSHMSWSFKKRVGFFTRVQWTGNGAANRAIAHDLGMAPGFVVIKRTDSTSLWPVWHRGLPAGHDLHISPAASVASTAAYYTAPDASNLYLGSGTEVNASGGSYTAWIWAHNPTIVHCGSVVVDGSGNGTATLGWEPQFVMLKGNMASAPYNTVDTARGWGTGSPKTIRLNEGGTEYSTASGMTKTTTGFTLAGLTAGTYLFVAIKKE